MKVLYSRNLATYFQIMIYDHLMQRVNNLYLSTFSNITLLNINQAEFDGERERSGEVRYSKINLNK